MLFPTALDYEARLGNDMPAQGVGHKNDLGIIGTIQLD